MGILGENLDCKLPLVYEAGIESGTDYSSRAPGFIPGFWWVRFAHIFSF